MSVLRKGKAMLVLLCIISVAAVVTAVTVIGKLGRGSLDGYLSALLSYWSQGFVMLAA